ncbi:hypothetical protein LIA77_08268 [Sarocladium implicatum]|nr:hypothetical protein LIA77_08268 [Sarocladium implicatum]
MGPRQRGGNQLPPSSAQRYPELFTTAQAQTGPRGRSNSGSQIVPAGFPRTQSNEFDIPGVGPPEDRGRRKSSGIFKEFGNRLARASSRDRRPSTSDNRPPTSDNVRSDVASETSVWTENNPERRKRSSLLSGLRKRPSMDMAASADDLRPPQAPMANQSQAFGPSASQNALPLPSEEERKSKSGLGGFSTDKFKLRTSRTERWDSNGPNGSHASVDQPQSDHGAGKSRLSGIGGKVAGLAGAFRRPQSEQSQAAAAQDHNEEARQVSQQHPPSSMAPPPPPAGQQPERRRRPSASGLLSGFVGKVTSRAGEQQQQQHPIEQPQQQGLHTGMRPVDMPSDAQMHAGRASMDQRPNISNSLSQQGFAQAGWGRENGQPAQQPSREPGIPPPSVDPRSSSGQPPSPELSRKDAPADGGRFDTVSPELSVRSGPQNPPAGQRDEDARNLQQGHIHPGHAPTGSSPQQEQRPTMDQARFENRLAHHQGSVHMGQQRQGGLNQQGSYSSGQLPPGQNAQQPPQQLVTGQGSLGPQNPQSSGFFRPQSSQPDALNVPGSRHSSMSLSQSSTQGRPQGEGSRWRGLKNRIGAQLATSNQTQERPGEKDERSGKTKLFGAFKRGSKQPNGPPVSMHQQAGRGQQWGPQSSPHPGPQGQSPGQPTHAMGYDPRNIQQGMVQPGQQRFSQTGGQPQHPAGGPDPQASYQYQRQPSIGGSIGQQPQVFQQNHGPAAGHPAQQPQQQVQPEKQYEQVPIPGPYGIVTGQGNAHNMDRQMRNYATSFQYNNAGQLPHPGQGPHVQQHQGLQHQGAVSAAPNTQTDNVGAMSQAPPGFETRRLSGANGTAQPVTRAADNITQVGRASPQQGQQSFLPSSTSPPPQSALPPPPSAATRPSYPREDSEVLPPGRQAFVKRKPTIPNGRSPTAPRETPVAATQHINDQGPKNNANLSVDVAKAEADKEEDIYDATPRVVQQDKMGPQTPEPSGAARGSTPTAPSPTPAPAPTIKPVVPSPEAKKVEPNTGKSFAMELEDTEEARKRTIRLDSQEEKIYYDPADDDDNPTMSATSYPGQEWNPYGEFEYSDIGDDAQNEGIRGR